MTEFKKLTAALDVEIEPSLALLFPPSSATARTSDIRERHGALTSLLSVLPALQERFDKMISRARETNPERQVFNEKTCVAMEALYSRFCLMLQVLFEWDSRRGDGVSVAEECPEGDGSSSGDDEEVVVPGEGGRPSPPTWAEMDTLMAWLDSGDVPFSKRDITTWDLGPLMEQLELEYAQDVVERSTMEAWGEEVAATLAGTLDQEEGARLVHTSTEHADRRRLLDAYNQSRRDARGAQEAREAAIWSAEVSRREAEVDAMHERCAHQDGFILASNCVKALNPPKAGTTILKAVLELLNEIIFRPENPNVRTIRNASKSFISTFGHPCVTPGQDIYHEVQTMLGCCGFTIRYSKKGTMRSKEIMALCAPYRHGVSGYLPVPTGNWGAETPSVPTYTPLGYEEYGERLLELNEPNAMDDPDEWCVWHEAMLARVAHLRDLLQ